MTTNKKAIECLTDLKANKKELEQKKRRARELDDEIEELEDLIRLGEKVSEIYKGVPLCMAYDDFFYNVQDTRRFKLYKNAHNNKTWGGYLQKVTNTGVEELWLGSWYETQEELIEIGKEWCAFGKIPKSHKGHCFR